MITVFKPTLRRLAADVLDANLLGTAALFHDDALHVDDAADGAGQDGGDGALLAEGALGEPGTDDR